MPWNCELYFDESGSLRPAAVTNNYFKEFLLLTAISLCLCMQRNRGPILPKLHLVSIR